MTRIAAQAAQALTPQYAIGLIDELATDDAILTCDSGTVATWAARHWTIRSERQFYLSGNLATMAPGLPYAIAVQHAFPGRQVIAYVGDGGFSMLMAEFLTAVRQGLPITVVIGNNSSLGQILWEQMVLGYPEHGVRYSEPVADFAAWATPHWPTMGRRWLTWTSTRTSRRYLARSATSRPRDSHSPGCAASRTKRPSPPHWSKTASPNCSRVRRTTP